MKFHRDVSWKLKERAPGIVAILAIWTLDWQWSIAIALVLYIFFGDRVSTLIYNNPCQNFTTYHSVTTCVGILLTKREVAL